MQSGPGPCAIQNERTQCAKTPPVTNPKKWDPEKEDNCQGGAPEKLGERLTAWSRLGKVRSEGEVHCANSGDDPGFITRKTSERDENRSERHPSPPVEINYRQ